MLLYLRAFPAMHEEGTADSAQPWYDDYLSIFLCS